METRQKRTIEIVVVLLVWSLVFLTVVGQAIGAALPGFDRPAITWDTDPHFRDLPDTGRGWLLIVLTVPVLLGYVFLRPRLTGDTVEAYWNDPFREDQ